ncbi:ComF family protein [candidate division WOR-3 bacterium]|jgi:ComF family protein|nr:ComF family protein [candidate division WOR-3 bacterium]
MLKLLNDICNFVFPPYCSICGEALEREKVVCNWCFGKIHFVTNKACRICGKPIKSGNICKTCKKNPPDFDFIIGCGNYVPPLSNIIRFYKYNYRTSLLKRLACILYSAYQTRGDVKRIKLVTWVPMRRAELRERGYNQSRQLADKFARLSGLRSVSLLRKARNIPSQTKLSNEGRLTNVLGAYEMDYGALDKVSEYIDNGVIIVDDVLTTGATLRECATALKEAGIPRVVGLVLAISP